MEGFPFHKGGRQVISGHIDGAPPRLARFFCRTFAAQGTCHRDRTKEAPSAADLVPHVPRQLGLRLRLPFQQRRSPVLTWRGRGGGVASCRDQWLDWTGLGPENQPIHHIQVTVTFVWEAQPENTSNDKTDFNFQGCSKNFWRLGGPAQIPASNPVTRKITHDILWVIVVVVVAALVCHCCMARQWV